MAKNDGTETTRVSGRIVEGRKGGKVGRSGVIKGVFEIKTRLDEGNGPEYSHNARQTVVTGENATVKSDKVSVRQEKKDTMPTMGNSGGGEEKKKSVRKLL